MSEPTTVRRTGPTSVPTGHLFGVGVGPGDPELLTFKARRVIGACDVVAHFAARHRPGNAWTIVEPLVEPHQPVLRLEYPVTTDAVERAGYEQALAAFYDHCADIVASELDAGRDVAVVCEGDPFFYGSYMYLHHRLVHRYPSTVVPGVTSVSAAAAAAGQPLVSLQESLTILPGVLAPDALKEALAGVDAAVVMKVGRHLDDVREALASAGLADQAWYVERASGAGERILRLADTDGVDAPYFSLVLVPGAGLAQRYPDRR
jgi:precorrin-2 C(20)-methyltransferase